jgi:hypothetical protein
MGKYIHTCVHTMAFVFGQAEITDNVGGTGLSSRKPVRLATIVNGTLATAFADGQTIDGVIATTGDRVLLKNQSSQVQNGVYIVQASGAPKRSPDYDDGDAVAGSFVYVQEGTTNASTGWLCTNTSGSDIIGVSAILFKLISGDVSGGASTDRAIVRWDGTTGTKIRDSTVILDDNANISGIGYEQFNDMAAPSNPVNGQGRLYKRTGDDGIWWKPDSAGVEVDLTVGFGSGGVLTTKGDLLTRDTIIDTRLPVGANNYLLAADSSTATGLRWAQSITPAQLPFAVVTATLAADVNDYSPAGLSTAVQLRLTATGADRNITGLAITGSAGAPNLSELKITNVGPQFNIILRTESAGSVAANRFSLDSKDVVILPGQNCTVWYDWTSSRWRGVASSSDGKHGGQYATAGIISPPVLASSQNDYSPTGLENAAVLRLTASAIVSLTGLAGGYSGRRIVLFNIGNLPITIVNQSLLSLAANRFFTGSSNTTIVGNNSTSLIYDGTSGFWRVYAGTGGAVTGAGGLVQSKWVEVITDRVTTSINWTNYASTINAAAVLPTGTVTVVTTGATAATPTVPGNTAASAASVANPQTIIVQSTTNDAQVVTYTGTTGTTFTGCTGGVGAIAIGNYVWNGPVQTSITVPSNGVSLPTGTINVVSTTGYPASGSLLVATTTNGTQKVAYTGITGTTFTGCTGGLGTMATGGRILNVSPVTPHDLLSIDITTSGGAIIIISTANASTDSNRTGYFQVLVDGFFRRGGSTQGNGGAPAGSAVVSLKLSDVPAGDHVVTVRWVIEGGTFAVRPVTRSQDNNASLLVQEVST